MRIIFKGAASSPDLYEFYGEVIVAHKAGKTVRYDLSGFPEGGRLLSAELMDGVPVLRAVKRDSAGLLVELPQRVIAGQYPGRKARWRGVHAIDAADYDPSICYVVPTGMAGVDDYEIVQGVDVAGNTGWTVRKKEMADG